MVVPPPEKSFIQKYWIYIAIALVALGEFAWSVLFLNLPLTQFFIIIVMSPAPPEEDGKGGGAKR